MAIAFIGNGNLFAQKVNKDSLAQVQKQQEALRKAQQASRDSAAKARQKTLEQMRAEQKRKTDSATAARKKISEQLAKARKHRTDSLARIRKYKESKKYKDSVARVRKEKVEVLQAARKAKADSAAAARKKIADSAIAARKVITDSIKARQKKRTDSLARIRKYKESKRYRDSVAVVKKMKLDSAQAIRKARTDSMTASRKKVADSLKAIRKAKTDSLTAMRKARTDSLAAQRKLRADSLAKKKEKREKDQKVRQKDKENRQQLAFELKLKKKRSAYSNEKMLKKRWGLPRQLVQNTFTRYNYYFNTDRKMDEALENMQRARKDNYDQMIELFPFNPDRDSSLLSADMDSIIQKASVGIQIHDPRTKWGDDLYLLLGQAYFYKGKYNEAAIAFRYILSLKDKKKKKSSSSSYSSSKSKGAPTLLQKDKQGALDFLKHRSVHNEAVLWLARTFTQSKQEGNAESVLDLVETDPNFPDALKGRLALEKSFIYLGQKDYAAASKQLGVVAQDKNLPDWVRMRAGFINGQIQQNRGEYVASAASFKQVTDLNPKIDMDFYAKKNMAYSLMLAGGDQQEAVASLKRVLNDGKYSPYYEQVYYVLGRLSSNSGKDEEAIGYLKEGLQSAKVTPKQKAQSFAALGGIYYKAGNYVESKAAYDSAAILASHLPPSDSGMIVAIKRSQALGKVTAPISIIRTQDSLLALAQLTEKEQRAAVRKYIRSLEQRRADSIFQAENAGLNAAMQNSTAGNPASNNPYANWYFANPALMQKGQNDFKSKWNNRPLADNWRRSAAGGFASNQGNNNNKQQTDDESPELDENGLPTEESLLAAIPVQPERQAVAVALIQKAHVDLANAYVRELEDYPPATRTLDTLDKRYTDHQYQAEGLYLRYLVAMRQNKLPESQAYADRILQQYGNTRWADLVRPTEGASEAQAVNNAEIAAYYDETYGMLIARDYEGALARVIQGQRQYKETNYAKRFRIMEGIARAGLGNYDAADTILQDFLKQYPSDSLKPWADAVLAYIQKNKPAAPPAPSVAPANGAAPPPASSTPAPAGSAAPTNASAAGGVPPPPPPSSTASSAAPVTGTTGAEQVAKTYTYAPNEEHYALFVFGAMEARAMGVKSALTDFNKFKFSSLNLTSTSEVLKADQGVIVTRSFKNASEAKIYLNMLRSTAQVFREYKPGEYQLVLISANNYRKMAADKDIKPYLQFYNTKYK